MTASQNKNISESTFGKLGWIVNKWMYKEGDNVTFENWVKLNDELFSGESYTVKDGDTILNEQLKIEKIGDDVYYTAIVKHNPGPVHFKLIEHGENKAVFENPEHDFPNRIIYELKEGNFLYARVEGKNKKGEDVTGEFFYTMAK
jgi:hypothetical protein